MKGLKGFKLGKIKLSKTRVASIFVGVGIAILGISVGWGALSGIASRASDSTPRDLVITSITENSAKVEWTTGQQTQGVIEYGTSATSLNFFAPETQKTTQHSVDLTLLSPDTTYYFQVRVGDTAADNAGVPWTFTTKGNQPVVETDISPTPNPNVDTKPSPVQTLVIPDGDGSTVVPTTTQNSCNETSCENIRAKFGKGCDTQDYIKCLKKGQ